MIRLYNVVLKENLLGSPFAPNVKCITAMIGTLGAAVLGGIASSVAQSSANSTNVELQRETNEMSQAQFIENMNWLREQYYTNRKWALNDRDYNTPQQIVDRLISAGINPASFFGSGSTSISPSSSVGAPSHSNFQAGHVDPLQFGDGLSESVARAIDSYHQNELIDAQADKTKNESQIARVNAVTQMMRNVAEIRKLMAETDLALENKGLSASQKEYYIKQKEDLNNRIDLFMRTIDDQAESLQLSNARIKRETNHIDFEENLATQRLNIEKALAASNIRLNGSQMSLLLQQCGLVAQQAQTEFERGRNISADTLSKNIENVIRALIRNEKVFEFSKVESSTLLKNIRGFSHYLGDLILGNIKGIFK